MPTYEYECPNGHTFERMQKMSDEPVSQCPECDAGAKRKISGGAGFLFKGDGFYITDYRSDEYKQKKSAEPGSKNKPADSGSPDAAPATPSKTPPASGGTSTSSSDD